VRQGEIALQTDGQLEFAQRTFGCAHREQDRPIGDVYIGSVGVHLQRLGRRGLGRTDLRITVLRHIHVDFPHMGIGEAQKGADVVRVEPERRFEEVASLPSRFERKGLVPCGPTVEGVIEGIEAVGMLAR
jgi:hypothetical protein